MVDVTNYNQYTEWLEKQPRAIITLLAIRNALRALPIMDGIIDLPKNKVVRALLLIALRNMAIALSLSRWSENAERFYFQSFAVKIITTRIINTNTSSVINSAEDAVNASRAHDAAHAAAYAQAAYEFARIDYKDIDFDAAAQNDVDCVAMNPTFKTLHKQPLWPKQQQTHLIGTLWDDLKTDLLALNENWSVWTEWYDALLAGNAPMIEEIEIGDPENGIYGRATFPEEMYEDPPKLNAALRQVIDDYWAKQVTLETPLPGAFDFSIKRGKLEASPSQNEIEQAKNAQDALETLKDIIKNCLEGLNANYADDLLKNAVASFLEKLPEKAGETQTGILNMRLAAINGFIGAYNQPDNETEKAVLGALLSVKSASETFSAYFTDIQKIKSVQLALNLQEQDTDAINLEIDNIIKIAEPSKIIGASSITALSTGLQELSELNAKIGLTPSLAQQAELNAAKSKVTAHRVVTTQNFLARTAKEMKDLPKDIYKSARKGLMSGVEDSAKGGVKVGLILLAFQLAGPVGALAATVATFRPFAKRAEDIKDEIEHIEI